MKLAGKTKDLLVFAILNFALALPAWIATRFVSAPQQPVRAEHSSDLGYTFSLGLFLVPCLIFGYWTLRTAGAPNRRRAFVFAVELLAPIGILLDVLLGTKFFVFPNRAATLAEKFPWALLPAYKSEPGIGRWFGGLFSSENWVRYIPIEEFAFYLLGFIAILLIYVWGDAVLFPRSKVGAQAAPKILQGLARSALTCFCVGCVLFGLALAIRASVPAEPGAIGMLVERAFPGYFLFLLCCSVMPSMIAFHIAYHFVNWKALTVAWLFLLAISQFWEGSLGVPYQWWDYRPNQMMGIHINPQCSLPVEAILVWTLASWTAVVVYEATLAYLNILDLPMTPGPQRARAAGGPKRRTRMEALKDLAKRDSSAAAIEELKQKYAAEQEKSMADH